MNNFVCSDRFTGALDKGNPGFVARSVAQLSDCGRKVSDIVIRARISARGFGHND